MAKKHISQSAPFNPDISGVKEKVDHKKQLEEQKKADEEKLSAWQRFARFFKNGRTRFAIGVVFLLFGIYLLIAFLSFCFGAGEADQNRLVYTAMQNAQPGRIHNLAGAIGAQVSQFFIADGVGVAAFVLVIWALTLGLRFLKKGRKTYFYSYTLVCLFSLFAFSLVIGFCTMELNTVPFPLGGAFGKYANQCLLGLLGYYGLAAVNFLVALIWVLLTFNTLKATFNAVRDKVQLPRRNFQGEEVDERADANADHSFLGDSDNDSGNASTQPATASSQPAPTGPMSHMHRNSGKRKTPQPVAADKPTQMRPIATATGVNPSKDPTGEYMHYQLPALDLLDDTPMKTSVDVAEQEANKQRITETLKTYGIEIKNIEVHVGPTVTLFEIIPQDGVRISKIRGLEDDIALSLAALGIRIIAPMPGRGTIGIEVPNHDPQIVPLRRVLESRAFQNTKAKLPMCLGCTVSNEVFVADLTKMPHLLVAGATGKGKSVGLNAIIMSLLYKKGPSELKFILVDPKRVEFSIYADLEKYFFALAPGEERAIVTDTQRVVHTLNCVVQEMEDRYSVLEDVKVRKVEDYNRLWREKLRDVRDADGKLKYHYMPYIVVIIDEFSDMIMTAGKEVETPIVRIAQKARAVGIHMIIATQRPSAQVITGLIKGNFPGRIAFAVSQMQDSRIILDRSGAQHLIGRGDMLFSVDGEITRLQCPFVDTPEIVKVCDYIKQQEDEDRNINHVPYQLPEFVAPADDGGAGSEGGAGGANLNDRDPLFEEAVKWIVQSDIASTSSLQRRYQIGYNRAGRIMDQMEAAGIVGPSQGGKPRKVLMSPMDVDQLFAH